MLSVHRPATKLALHGVEASRRIEQQAQTALPAHTLMRRAGQAVARLALAIAPHARRVWIAAGPGNNGGDGFDAAIHLRQAGKEVAISFAGAAARLPADAADAFARAQSAGVRIGTDDAPDDLGPHDLAIDALLGLGASRAPESRVAELVAQLNALACARLAVDLPSGLDAMTGQPLGSACVRATHTLALLTLKPGLFTGQGRDFAGEVWFDDLGVDAAAIAPPDAWLSGAADAARSPRRHASHKGSYGDVAVVGGAPGMTGAALLAARAAHAAGAGRVFVSLLEPDAPGQGMALDPARPELMFRRAWWQSAPGVIAESTVVAGCGGGDAVRHVLPRLLSLAPRLVLDADALNAIAVDSALQELLAARAIKGLGTVLTPHPLEAARLLAIDAASVQRDRLRGARSLADRFGCVALLKGSGTVIAAAGRPPHINPTGNAALATAGSGDVLAGWIAGLWSADGRGEQGFDLASAAAHAQGAAADASPVAPLRAADLVEAMLAQRAVS